jgi:hypothetical protein
VPSKFRGQFRRQHPLKKSEASRSCARSPGKLFVDFSRERPRVASFGERVSKTYTTTKSLEVCALSKKTGCQFATHLAPIVANCPNGEAYATRRNENKYVKDPDRASSSSGPCSFLAELRLPAPGDATATRYNFAPNAIALISQRIRPTTPVGFPGYCEWSLRLFSFVFDQRPAISPAGLKSLTTES